MADLADVSDEKVQAIIDNGVEAVLKGRNDPFRGLTPTGWCHWCHESVPEGRTHCCPAVDGCAEDHEKYLRMKGETR